MRRHSLPLVAALILAGCAGNDNQGGPTVTRTTLPNGAVHIAYERRPEAGAWSLEETLRLGRTDGPEEQLFGDIRGIAQTAEGEIIVLDYMAAEVRRFSAEGEFIELVARRGDGPGEIGDSNGLAIDDEGTIWINDHSHYVQHGIRRDGGLARIRFTALRFRYLWEGGPAQGWMWEPRPYSDANRLPRPNPGVHDDALRQYVVGTNLDQDSTERVVDSLYVGDYETPYIVVERGGARVPFSPIFLTAIDSHGFIWTAWGGEYRLTKHSLEGDTLLVVEFPSEPVPVTAEERSSALERLESFLDRAGRISLDYDEILPKHHPRLEQLIVDADGNVWARRHVRDGITEYDVFSSAGEYVATATTDLPVSPFFVPSISSGDFLTVVTGELDIPYVVRLRIVR